MLGTLIEIKNIREARLRRHLRKIELRLSEARVEIEACKRFQREMRVRKEVAASETVAVNGAGLDKLREKLNRSYRDEIKNQQQIREATEQIDELGHAKTEKQREIFQCARGIEKLMFLKEELP